MTIEWDESLSTGIDEIDNQHKEIINRIVEIQNKANESMSMEEIDEAVRFIGGYVFEHFSKEEEKMIKYKYPNYDSHKAEHMSFLKSFMFLKKMTKESGITSMIILAIQNQVVDWLVKHITSVDKEMATFLRKNI